MLVTELDIVMEFRPLQPLKASFPMVFTSSPITIVLMDLLLENQFPISLQWKVTEVRPEQPENAEPLMVVTVLGMVIVVRPLHPEKALLLIVVTSSPRIISLIDVLLLNQFPTSLQWKVTEVRPEQPEKAELPMEVTDLGIVIEAKLLQPENALLPIVVTELGIVKDVSLVQFSKALLPILVTVLGSETDVNPLQPWKV